MSEALPAPLRDPVQCLNGLVEAAFRLTNDFNVDIRHAYLPPGKLGDWQSTTRTLLVAKDATLEDMTWLFNQALLLLCIGPEAAAAAHRAPMLQIVPEPRAANENNSPRNYRKISSIDD